MTDRISRKVVDGGIVRAVTLFAAAIAGALAIALPTTHFITSWQREFATSHAEAVSIAAVVTEYATRNAELWEFEGHRISGVLSIGARTGMRRILGDAGGLVAEFSAETLDGAPVVRATAPIFDGSDRPVGNVEITHSLRQVYFQTAVVGSVAIGLAFVAFLALRWVPLRMLERAFQSLMEARDRAERAEAEARCSLAKAEGSDRSKARFLAAMNHEFRTPIGQVAGFSELLLNEALLGRAGSARVEWLKDVHAAAQDLLGLLEDVTRYAQLDDTGNSLLLRPVVLQKLADGGARLAQSALQKAGIAIHLDRKEQSAEPLVDAALIEEAVGCLLREIARRAPPGSEIRITFESGSDEGVIVLHCAGLDFSRANLNNLRAPLDVRDILTRGQEGACLGAAVAERIARLHGGRLWIGAWRDGGLAMTISLPILENPQPA